MVNSQRGIRSKVASVQHCNNIIYFLPLLAPLPPLEPPRPPRPPFPPRGTSPFPLAISSRLRVNPPPFIFPNEAPKPLSLFSPSFARFSFKLSASLPILAPTRIPAAASLPWALLRFMADCPRRRVRGALGGSGVRPFNAFVGAMGKAERSCGSWEWVVEVLGAVRGRSMSDRWVSSVAR